MESDYIQSRSTILNQLELQYITLNTKILNYLEDILFVSLTTDMWTSRATKLGTTEVDAGNISENLRERLLNVIRNWKLTNKTIIHGNELLLMLLAEFAHSIASFILCNYALINL